MMTSTANLTSRARAEACFRVVAFRIAYDKVFAQVSDLSTRFVYAIAYSSRPIENWDLVMAWWKWTNGKSIKALLDSGHEPPAKLRPLVNEYLAALKKRAQLTGDREDELD